MLHDICSAFCLHLYGMDFFLICATAILGSALTFFSGFGLGTLLLPVFGLFFPIETAVAMTAVVHFLNNLFKLSLTYKHMQPQLLLRFGLPAMVAAIAGAWLLGQLPATAWYTYSIGGHVCDITLLKLIVGALMIGFAFLELLPAFQHWSVAPKWIPIGGVLSGFFGGLSGHQGALRSAFLLRLKLDKQAFVATGIGIACLIDISRLTLYSQQLQQQQQSLPWTLIGSATLSAFAGAWLGNKWLKKLTLHSFQYLVAVFIVLFGIALVMGIV